MLYVLLAALSLLLIVLCIWAITPYIKNVFFQYKLLKSKIKKGTNTYDLLQYADEYNRVRNNLIEAIVIIVVVIGVILAGVIYVFSFI